MTAYLSSPFLSSRHVAFVCADAVWIAERESLQPRRLTSDVESASSPLIDPGEQLVAYASNVEGTPQVHVVPLAGGAAWRLTNEASGAVPVAFRPSGKLVVRSRRLAHARAAQHLFEIDAPREGQPAGPLVQLAVGRALGIAFDQDDDRVLIERNRQDTARWKRYRGGTVGDVWIGSLAKASFRRLLDIEAQLDGAGPVQPVFCAGRVYFVSDKDGIGNVWSTTPEGSDLRQHTHGREYFVRTLRASGSELVFARGAELFVLDTENGEERRLDVHPRPNRLALGRKFVTAPDELCELVLAPDGKRLAATLRGKLQWMEAWGVGASSLGTPAGVRYRLPVWLAPRAPLASQEPEGAVAAPETKTTELVVVSDEGGEDHLELFDVTAADRGPRSVLPLGAAARPRELIAHPLARSVAMTDIAGKLWLFDLDGDGGPQLVRSAERSPIRCVCWSADGRYLAWVEHLAWLLEGGVLQVHDTRTGLTHALNEPELPVHSPSFDPLGRFLWVLSERTFNPLFDSQQFNAVTTDATRVYAFVLRREGLSPFDPRFAELAGEQERAHEKLVEALEGDEAERAKLAPRPVEIDFEGLSERIVEVPDLEPASYTDLQAVKDGLLVLDWPRIGLLDVDAWTGDTPRPTLTHLEVSTGKQTEIHGEAAEYQERGGQTLVRTKDSAWLWKTGEELPEEPARKGRNAQTGELALERLRVEVDPQAEWRQMFDEAWRLQRDSFWDADLAGVDWNRVRVKYASLLPKLASRAELSDLIWEMQGELGTSHAYEFGGDYPETKDYPVGSLGADFAWDGRGWKVTRILRGDAWMPGARSPLAAPGVGVVEGDRLVAIDGEPLDERTEPVARLTNRAGQDVELGILSAEGQTRRTFACCLRSEEKLRYRDWVRGNRERVRTASEGRLGYLHIPDMGGPGLAEFFRAWRAESKFPGLVVDVRENGGGFVSPIVLDCLRRQVLGYDRPRYGQWVSYPDDTVRGPQVMLADEYAGSDGDMITFGFRASGLGPVIGKRTWGGVIGIEVDGALADGTIVTQPAFSFCALGEGWGLENRGVSPDIEVEFDPASMARGEDPQLERAIEVALAALREKPVSDPVWPPVPSRKLP